MKKLILAFLFWSVVFTTKSHAYLDPGSAGGLIQMMLAAIAAGLAGVKIWWSKIKTFFNSIFKKKKKKID